MKSRINSTASTSTDLYSNSKLNWSRCPQSTYLSSILTDAATLVIHRLSQEILNFSMYMLGCKIAL